MIDVCVLCGFQGEALGPPPHVCMLCVLKANGGTTYTRYGNKQKIFRVDNIANTSKTEIAHGTTIRERLHPAVFLEA
jgi:hypothetical protein